MTASWSQDIYVNAWDFATRAHAGQTYGGPRDGERLPYINHIGAVAMEVAWAVAVSSGHDSNLAVQCALLHDTIEDTDCTYQDISAEFGTRVADGVLALSKDPALATKAEQMHDSLDRIRQQPAEIWMVKMADRITNLSEPPHYWTDGKKRAYQAEATLIHDALRSAHQGLADRLAQKISDYAAYIGDSQD